MKEQYDFLIIGTGLAGLSLALKMRNLGSVLLVSKTSALETNSNMAQGGIAAVQAQEDDFESHIKDTLAAGAGLCDPKIVRKVIENAPERILELEDWGVKFDKGLRNPSNCANDRDLNREGGHSHRRILHVRDQTGAAIQQALLTQVMRDPQITIIENHIAIDLITSHQATPQSIDPKRCLGAYFLDRKHRKIVSIFAKYTLLSSGGAGKVYLYTSNWEGATGDGIAMAFRAGCRVSNMEFIQFHPTCLFHPQNRNFLISEALRGEGAELINYKGEKFTYRFDPRGPLAPRDIVARAIDAEMKESGAECVYLDIRSKGKAFLQKHFPVIYGKCFDLGYDLAESPLPVVPAAHYMCGGILTDEFGQTDLQGLYAIGECAYTGLHGANRLASNSLLECLSFSHFAYEKIAQEFEHSAPPQKISFQHGLRLKKENHEELMLISHLWDEIRSSMWNYVGIVRSQSRLLRARTRLLYIRNEIEEYYTRYRIHSDIIELRNLATVARLNVESALRRPLSVGTHYKIDAPKDKKLEDSKITSLSAIDLVSSSRNF